MPTFDLNIADDDNNNNNILSLHPIGYITAHPPSLPLTTQQLSTYALDVVNACRENKIIRPRFMTRPCYGLFRWAIFDLARPSVSSSMLTYLYINI